MNSLIVLAALDDILQFVGIAVFFLLWALGPILKGIAARNKKLAQNAQRANQAPGQRAAPDPRAEVDRFLREVAKKDDRATIASEIVLGEDDLLQPPPQRRPVRKQKRRPQNSPRSNSIESRHLPSTLRDRPERHSALEQADEKMAGHVHDVFDHKLGQLGASTGPRGSLASEAAAGHVPKVAGTAIPTSAGSVADMLRDPATVRQAILIHEILGPPRCQSTDIGHSD